MRVLWCGCSGVDKLPALLLKKVEQKHPGLLGMIVIACCEVYV